MQNRMNKLRAVYNEYPRTFWTLILITFIDRIGGSMLFPFFALYLTKRFDIGMTQVGVLFAAFSVSSFTGSMLGGALTDRFGRKKIIIFGLIASSVSTLAMGLVNSVAHFFVQLTRPCWQISSLKSSARRDLVYSAWRSIFRL